MYALGRVEVCFQFAEGGITLDLLDNAAFELSTNNARRRFGMNLPGVFMPLQHAGFTQLHLWNLDLVQPKRTKRRLLIQRKMVNPFLQQ